MKQESKKKKKEVEQEGCKGLGSRRGGWKMPSDSFSEEAFSKQWCWSGYLKDKEPSLRILG